MSDRTLPGIQPKDGRQARTWPWIVGMAGGVVLIAVIVGLSVGGDKDRDYDSDTSYEAIAQCEAAVQERLKAPSTAKFESTATGGGTWTVRGTVDSENGFGAMVRSDYQCTVIINNTEDTARVRVDSLG